MGQTDIPLSLLLCAAVVLVLLSMTFSAAESAFLAINKLRVRLLKNQRNRRAIRVWNLLSDRSRLINTLLVGNNIVNIALSALFSYVAIDLFGSAGIGLATFAVTIILLIFGEISPKTAATHHPEAIAFFLCDFIYILEIVLKPFVFVFTRISSFLLKTLKVDMKGKTVSYTEEEIKTFLDVGHETGIIEHNESSMMKRVFKFTDLEAKDIMIPRKKIQAVNVEDSYWKVLELSQRYRLSRFPVFKKDIDDIVGIIYIKDMLAFKTHPELFSITRVMRPPLFILGTKKMSGIQQMLRENHQSMAVVIDEYSGTEGILTVEDIAQEIFGSESNGFHEYHQNGNRDLGTDEVEGLMRLEDVNDLFGAKFESEDSETVGGYLMEVLGAVPKVGDRIQVDGYTLTVTEMEDKRVSKIKIVGAE
ncbi:MAG: hemolysin family protein [Treponema sp.]|nr:hemolysin family protein [Treponema sp.]